MASSFIFYNCGVCGVETGMLVHDNKCCMACEAFFRRTSIDDKFKKFRCSKNNGNCTVDVSSRRRCQYCRFQKCLSIGMELKTENSTATCQMLQPIPDRRWRLHQDRCVYLTDHQMQVRSALVLSLAFKLNAWYCTKIPHVAALNDTSKSPLLKNCLMEAAIITSLFGFDPVLKSWNHQGENSLINPVMPNMPGKEAFNMFDLYSIEYKSYMFANVS